ncbi:serine O-acetyltransferase [Rhodopseudomonas julia]|uniref:Serine acetyltransferase n=1 Tax=Rhodopseudomonas julia TaxID=200617 RepID=A0ABU0C8L9_9BRAD|nr:serine O-acetyltransferase [Rhodopseudomonas julia]MDQ0326866.1 serine O-acetyltransferase [Rhodopseudomonas julia]
MAVEQTRLSSGAETVDPVWAQLRREAEDIVARETVLAAFIYSTILNYPRLEDAVAHRVGDRLRHPGISTGQIIRSFGEMYEDQPELSEVLRIDLMAVYDRDPACERLIEPVLYFKGFHAIQSHRLAHWLWQQGHKDYALYLQSRASEVFQVDIHPAVPLGRGIFIDHATGIVIGSTAVIEDDVSILQNVTLGGTGKSCGDRHPKIRHGVLIGAGAEVLGNIEVGHCSRVAAGSVVLKPVPPMVTVAGVPARIVGKAGRDEPGRSMDQLLREAEQGSDDVSG